MVALHFVPPALVLLAGLFAVLALRRQALAADFDPQAVWFGFTRRQKDIGLGIWLAWYIASQLFGANRIVWFALDSTTSPQRFGVDVAFLLLPPSLVMIACAGLAYPVYARVRGAFWTRAGLMRRSFWAHLGNVAFGLLTVAGIVALIDQMTRQGMVLILGGVAVSMFASLRLGRLRAESMAALTTGELRDRAFALAQEAGISLEQLYLMPANKEVDDNAGVISPNTLQLRDDFLQLSKREVDFFVAHRLARLQLVTTDKLKPLPWHDKLMVVIVVLACGLGGLLSVPLWAGDWRGVGPLLPLLFGALLAARFLLGKVQERSVERSADAKAVLWTKDPEAGLRALFKLDQTRWTPARPRTQPDSPPNTPGMWQRALALAEMEGISHDRLLELANRPESQTDRYSLPPEAAGREPIFSTAFKHQGQIKKFWIMIAADGLVPALIAGYLVPLADDSSTQWAMALVAVGLTALAHDSWNHWLDSRDYHRLRRRLASRWIAEGLDPKVFGGQFVSFAPGSVLLGYDRFFDWDIGFLILTAGRLVYLGERTRFSLRRDQIKSIQSGLGMPFWCPAPFLYVAWCDDERGTGGVFRIWRADVHVPWLYAAATARLAEEIHAWHHAPLLPETLPVLPDLPTPDFTTVTGTPLRQWTGPAQFFPTLVVFLILTAAIAYLCDLPYTGPFLRSAWFPLAAMGLLSTISMVPFWLYPDTTQLSRNGAPDPKDSSPSQLA